MLQVYFVVRIKKPRIPSEGLSTFFPFAVRNINSVIPNNSAFQYPTETDNSDETVSKKANKCQLWVYKNLRHDLVYTDPRY